jgi:hypothetical protein
VQNLHIRLNAFFAWNLRLHCIASIQWRTAIGAILFRDHFSMAESLSETGDLVDNSILFIFNWTNR